MHLVISEALLRKHWPKATDAVIKGTAAAWPDVADHFGIDTLVRAAHFWGQISWECNWGTELREDGHYTADGIMRTFGVGKHSAAITRPEAENLARICRQDGGRTLFNRTYGAGNPHMAKILGNVNPDGSIAPDVGRLKRGAGSLNTTGGDDFRRVSKLIGIDIDANPDLAKDPRIALWMGAAEYVDKGCLKFADADNTHDETLKINGGLNGLDHRIEQIALWRADLARVASVASAAPDAKVPLAPIGHDAKDVGAAAGGIGLLAYILTALKDHPLLAASAAIGVAAGFYLIHLARAAGRRRDEQKDIAT